jgi:hypothetical protein
MDDINYEDIVTRRIYSFENGVKITETAGKSKRLGPASIESFDGSPLIGVENHNDLGSYIASFASTEDLNPTRSIEVRVFDENAGLGISVYINTTHEHGYFGNTSSPAHVHVKNSNEIDIGQVNINDSCPKNGKEVPLYRTSNEKLFNNYRDKIAKWANSKKKLIVNKKETIISYWEYAQREWKRLEMMGIFNK